MGGRGVFLKWGGGFVWGSGRIPIWKEEGPIRIVKVGRVRIGKAGLIRTGGRGGDSCEVWQSQIGTGAGEGADSYREEDGFLRIPVKKVHILNTCSIGILLSFYSSRRQAGFRALYQVK